MGGDRLGNANVTKTIFYSPHCDGSVATMESCYGERLKKSDEEVKEEEQENNNVLLIATPPHGIQMG